MKSPKSIKNDRRKSHKTTNNACGAEPVPGRPSDVENPRHREDFTSLLNEAARKREQED